MTEEDTTDGPTLGEMSHTNPYTDESFGATQTYARGRTIAADGGAAEAYADETDTMADVSHEPPRNAESANGAYQRGNEDDA